MPPTRQKLNTGLNEWYYPRMKCFSIRIAVALLTFVTGVYVTSQVNRAAYFIWPDVDPQPKAVSSTRPCFRAESR